MEDQLRLLSIVLAVMLVLCIGTMEFMTRKYRKVCRRMKRSRDSLMELWYASDPKYRDDPTILPDAREHARKVLRMETKDPETVPDLNRVAE